MNWISAESAWRRSGGAYTAIFGLATLAMPWNQKTPHPSPIRPMEGPILPISASIYRRISSPFVPDPGDGSGAG